MRGITNPSSSPAKDDKAHSGDCAVEAALELVKIVLKHGQVVSPSSETNSEHELAHLDIFTSVTD